MQSLINLLKQYFIYPWVWENNHTSSILKIIIKILLKYQQTYIWVHIPKCFKYKSNHINCSLMCSWEQGFKGLGGGWTVNDNGLQHLKTLSLSRAKLTFKKPFVLLGVNEIFFWPLYKASLNFGWPLSCTYCLLENFWLYLYTTQGHWSQQHKRWHIVIQFCGLDDQ
jgi:hypothetical protein